MSDAPGEDEVEAVARAIAGDLGYDHRQESRALGTLAPGDWLGMAEAALAALAPLRQAERERAWLAGAEAMRDEICRHAAIVSGPRIAVALSSIQPTPSQGDAP